MKNNTPSQTANHNTQFNKNKKAPEVRDNLDSRKKEEQDTKGDDITHNHKDQHNKQQKPKEK